MTSKLSATMPTFCKINPLYYTASFLKTRLVFSYIIIFLNLSKRLSPIKSGACGPWTHAPV